MKFFYLELLLGLPTFNLLEEGVEFVGGNRVVKGGLPDFYVLNHVLSMDLIVIAAFLCLLFYFVIDYETRLHSCEKSKFTMNMVHSAHTPWMSLRKQSGTKLPSRFLELVRQKVRQYLENIDYLLTCNQNGIDFDKTTWKSISILSVGEFKLYPYTDLVGTLRHLYNNLSPVQLRAYDYSKYFFCGINKVAMSSMISPFSLNKMRDVSVTPTNRSQNTILSQVTPSEVHIDNCQRIEGGTGTINCGGAIQMDEKKIQTNEIDARPCILLMMSDEQFSDYLKTSLSEYFKITVLDNPNMVMKTVTHNSFEVIIVDESVNGISGDEICVWIKENEVIAEIPLVLLVQAEDAESYFSHIKSKADRLELRTIDVDKFAVDLRVLINSYATHRKQVRPYWDNLPPIFIPAKLKNSEDNLQFIETVEKLLAENILKQKYTVEMLASDVGVSRTKFYTKMRELTGGSPREYIMNFRMKIAVKLLISGDYNVTEVSGMVGFCDSKYFGKTFKKLYHTSPTKYVQKSNSL